MDVVTIDGYNGIFCDEVVDAMLPLFDIDPLCCEADTTSLTSVPWIRSGKLCVLGSCNVDGGLLMVSVVGSCNVDGGLLLVSVDKALCGKSGTLVCVDDETVAVCVDNDKDTLCMDTDGVVFPP